MHCLFVSFATAMLAICPGPTGTAGKPRKDNAPKEVIHLCISRLPEFRGPIHITPLSYALAKVNYHLIPGVAPTDIEMRFAVFFNRYNIEAGWVESIFYRDVKSGRFRF